MERRIETAVSLIKSGFATPIREPDIASRVGLSTSRFRHLFKQQTRQSFTQYVRAYRVAKADEMIRADPSLLIKEVAMAVGYRHVSSFDRDFRKCLGRAPLRQKCPLGSRFGQ